MKKKNYILENRHEIAVLIKLNQGQSSYYPYSDVFQYLEVDMDFDRLSLKPVLFHDEEQWTYRLLRNVTDSLANWQGREQAIDYMGEDAITDAEKKVSINLRNLKKEVKLAQENPVWLQMKDIADSIIIHYKTDFYYHDALILHRNKPEKFLWFVRPTGSWLTYYQNNFARSVLNEELKPFGTKHEFIGFWNNGKYKMIEKDQYDRLMYYYGQLPKEQPKED